jgi:arsenite methyltransferase
METSQERTKQQVRERYTSAVESGHGCCGHSNGCGAKSNPDTILPVDRIVSSAGYLPEQLTSLPADAVSNSFGCGNPLAFSEVKWGQTVMDIGSGAGIDCLLAAQKVGPQGKIIGIDMTPVMIEKARKNAKKAGATNVEFRLGEAEKMPVETNTIDWIVSNCVINLSPDKPSVFKEAFRVMRSGGNLSVSDIMVEALPWFLRRSAVLYASCVAGAIPEKEYLAGLRQAGFTDVHVTNRIVYDRDQVMSLIQGAGYMQFLSKWFPQILAWFLDRHIVGKIWSSHVVARKT